MKKGGFWAGVIAALCARAAFAVADTTPPLLTALSFPIAVDVTSGPATVAVNYSATDDLSGVYYFAIDFRGPGLGCGGAGASTS